MVNFTDTKFYSFWISSVTKVRDAFGKRRSKKAAEARIDREAESPPSSRRSLQVKRQPSNGPLSLLQLSSKALCQNHKKLTADDLNELPCDVIQGILDEFVATDQLTLPVLQLFRRQSVYNFVVSDLPDLRENWLAELTAAPLHRVHLTRCSQVYPDCFESCRSIEPATLDMHVRSNFDLLAIVQVSDASMLALRHQNCLTDLDLHDCIKLTDEGVACLQGKTAWQQTALLAQWLSCKPDYWHLSSAIELNSTIVLSRLIPADLACPAGLTALTILNMHGCEVITSRGIQSICALTNLQHLNLALCNRAAGLQHIAGEQSKQQRACCLSKDRNKPI